MGNMKSADDVLLETEPPPSRPLPPARSGRGATSTAATAALASPTARSRSGGSGSRGSSAAAPEARGEIVTEIRRARLYVRRRHTFWQLFPKLHHEINRKLEDALRSNKTREVREFQRSLSVGSSRLPDRDGGVGDEPALRLNRFKVRTVDLEDDVVESGGSGGQQGGQGGKGGTASANSGSNGGGQQGGQGGKGSTASANSGGGGTKNGGT
ncbi:glycine, alanine and asparagine-rich protein-like [Eucalyptus grandis]|uniref:glycine, alanine and asparagine-rich protein-like n=1 Tax=Eucalyptus grandis TaxID=71139 RepID=UPI00192E82C4|nr:glycine, alanine and asparagine-rich protein-like [Eucalyptus grandis]